jgi:hypothetical protein
MARSAVHGHRVARCGVPRLDDIANAGASDLQTAGTVRHALLAYMDLMVDCMCGQANAQAWSADDRDAARDPRETAGVAEEKLVPRLVVSQGKLPARVAYPRITVSSQIPERFPK